MNRIEKIKQYRKTIEKKEEAKAQVEEAMLNDLVAQIKALKPRIDALIELGNACLENGIEIDSYRNSGCCNANVHYWNGTFVTNGISHQLGFIPPVDNRIYEMGIYAGGAFGPWHFQTNGDSVFMIAERDGNERAVLVKDISFLQKFIDNFDEFEIRLYEYIDDICNDGNEEEPYCQINISYSWGDKEEPIPCTILDTAWEKVKQMALKEAEISSIEHACEIGLTFDNIDHRITLHYTYDDSYCYYTISKRGE